jgi:hypothetical protein
MDSPSLVLLHITLKDFDGIPSKPIRVFTNLHITLGDEIVLIDVEVGCSFGLQHAT